MNEEEQERAAELLMRADSYLSLLWYRGYVDKLKVMGSDGLVQELQQLMSELRGFNDRHSRRNRPQT